MRAVAKCLVVPLEGRGERRAGVHVAGCAELLRETGQGYVLDVKRVVPIMEGAHFFSLSFFGGPSSGRYNGPFCPQADRRVASSSRRQILRMVE
jgi:hypothetical protein